MCQYGIEYPILEANVEHCSLDNMQEAVANANYGVLERLPEDYFKRPWLYFLVDGNYLMCLGVREKIQCEPAYDVPEDIQKAVSSLYPRLFKMHKSDSGLLCPLYVWVYRALAHRKFTRYYNTLMKFKWEAGLMDFPLFEQKNRICKIDGRLYGQVVDGDSHSWKFLTDEVVDKEINARLGHQFKGKELKTTLAKELLKFHDEQLSVIENNGNIHVETPNYTISYNLQLDQADIVKKNFYYHAITREPKLSSQGYDCLHKLTQGKIAVLNDIAELLARLYQPQQPSGYLWVILGKDEKISSFLRLLADLGSYAAGFAIYEKPSSQRAKQLIIERSEGKNCQINYRLLRLRSSSDIDLSSFRKFIAGETVDTIDDPYVINSDVKGAGVLLCAVTELFEESLGGIPHKIIAIPSEWSLYIEESDYLWLETCLLCHGFHLLYKRTVESEPCTLSLDDAIGKFFEAFCKNREGSYTDRKHFYEQFKKYCDIVINMSDELPGSTIFSKHVETRFCWKSRAVRSNNNRLGYENVFLDDDKIEAVIRQAEEQKAVQAIQATPDDFKAYLDSFSNYLHIPGSLRSL